MPVEAVTIEISDDLELIGTPHSLEDARIKFRQDAEKIYDVMSKHLPQGTQHQLLILMLENHQNLYCGI